MKVHYDPAADALNITFMEGKVYETKEITPEVLLDVDREGSPLYLEILDARKRYGTLNIEEILFRLPAINSAQSKSKIFA